MRRDPPESEDADKRPSPDDAVRARLERATLELAGEQGYETLTVQMILARTGTSRSAFYALFSGKEECYATAYEGAAARLEGELLAPCEEAPDWPGGLHGALEVLARLLAARPDWARGVLVEVQVAGGVAGARRKEVFERLSRAIDRARREIDPSRHPPPPVTASFILAAIESAAVRSLRPRHARDFAEIVPELLYLAVAPYLGPAAAASVYRRALRR